MRLDTIVASVCKVNFHTFYDADKMLEVSKLAHELAPISMVEEVSAHRFAWIYPEGMSGVEEELVERSPYVESCRPYIVEIYPYKGP